MRTGRDSNPSPLTQRTDNIAARFVDLRVNCGSVDAACLASDNTDL
jgi:hypothetical protein